MTGYRIHDKTLSVEQLPGRKQISLNRTVGNVCYPMAYFKDQKDAEWTNLFLDQLALAKLVIAKEPELVVVKEAE